MGISRMKSAKDNSQLTLLGGVPAFTEMLHVGRPNIGDRDQLLKRIGDLLDRRWLTNNGPLVQEFEKALCDFTGAKHCIAMTNATIGLEIAIRAAGLKGEVIVPSFTFVATAHALQWQEITPVFCDVDPVTHNLDPAKVEELITPDTTGIIGVHLWGRPCDTAALQAIADRHKLTLMYDAAHAFGCSHNGEMVGNFGLAEVFSFHATKIMNSFEGGAVTTNDDELAHKIRLMSNFGFTGLDSVDYIGTNGKMSEVSAAMGLTSLESFDDFVAVNKRNHDAYRQHLASVRGLHLLSYEENEKNNCQYVVLEVDEEITGISRDNLVRTLHAENVRARRYFYPGCHRMEPYKSLRPLAGDALPVTNALTERVMCLPTGTAVNPADIKLICELIATAIEHSEELNRALDG